MLLICPIYPNQNIMEDMVAVILNTPTWQWWPWHPWLLKMNIRSPSSKLAEKSSGLFSLFKKNCSNPADIYLLKVNNRNTRTRCEICSKLTTKTPDVVLIVFTVIFEHISPLVLVFLLLTLNMYLPAGKICSMTNFQQPVKRKRLSKQVAWLITNSRRTGKKSTL